MLTLSNTEFTNLQAMYKATLPALNCLLHAMFGCKVEMGLNNPLADNTSSQQARTPGAECPRQLSMWPQPI